MEKVIEINNITTMMNHVVIHKQLTMDVNRGEILGIVGPSGSGKTVLLRTMLMLQPFVGSIRIFDQDIEKIDVATKQQIESRFGVLFQQNALFSSLTVLENVAFPLQEQHIFSTQDIHELAMLKIKWVGLPTDAAAKYPAELSGGMQKRAALARAIVLDPEIVFLDEPTTGLDPDSADGLDALIANLQKTMNLTVVMVTHDLDTLWRITNRVAFLGEGKVLSIEPIEKLVKQPHPLIKAFFQGPRGRTVERGLSDGN